MGLEARDFSEKIFLEKSKSLCYLSCASRRLGLGVVPLLYPKTAKLPQIRLYKRLKRLKRCKCTHETNKRLKTA